MTSVVLTIALLLAQAAAAPRTAPSGLRIAGTLVDALTGAPIEGGEVFAAPAGDPSRMVTTTSMAGGQFALEHLQAGKYTLSARHAGYPVQEYEQHDAFSTAVVVGPALDSDAILFRLRPEASISGRVSDEHGEPVRGAQVVLLRAGVIDGLEDIRRAGGATTDDLGQYHLGRVSAGTYYVAVYARPWYAESRLYVPRGDAPLTPEQARENALLNVAYPLTYFSSASEIGDADPLLLRPGDRVTADIALHPVPSVTISVPNDGAGRTRAAPMVMLSLPGGGTLGARTSSMQRSDGPTEIVGLAPGHYSMTLRSPGDPNGTSQQDVDVTGDMTVAPQANQAARVSGTVAFEGAPPAHCFVRLRSLRTRMDYVADVPSSGEISFRRNPPAGDYEVWVTGAPGLYVKKMALGGAAISDRQITIGAGDTITLAITAGRGTGRVEGFARKNDKGLAGAMVLLLPDHWEQNSALVRRDQSDSDGSFTLSDVAPGDYLLLAVENGWDLEWRNPAVIQPFLKNAERLQIAAGGSYKATLSVQAAK